MTCPADAFAAIASAVAERQLRDATPGDDVATSEKLRRSLSKISQSDFDSWIQSAQQKGNPVMLQKVIDIAKSLAVDEDSSLVINIVPYQVKDEALPNIIDKCDAVRFLELKQAVAKRVKREQDAARMRQIAKDRRASANKPAT